jgi:small subunit ribosomal protein S10
MANKIRIRLKGFDDGVVEAAAAEIVGTAKRTGAETRGPIPLPRKIERFSVNRGPHIDKESQDQFEIRTHTRIIDLVEPTQQTLEALSKLEIAAGVSVEVIGQ